MHIEAIKHLRPLVDAGGDLYIVGGPVRDSLLANHIKDIDILCRLLPLKVICNILKPYGKVALVGKSFGVIKFSPYKDTTLEIDIALPRVEKSTGSGHRDFEVDFDPSIDVQDDLSRRDFTINAMAWSVATNSIIDPFGGQKDLKDKILRQVFPRAFEEDPLRLIRAVQFAARFELTIEATTWQAMIEHARLIETVSGERISEEFIKLFRARKPSYGFTLMRDSGILLYILPELHALVGVRQDKQPGDDVFAHTLRVLDATSHDEVIDHKGQIELMFAALFHDIGKAKTARYHEPSKRTVFFGHQIVSVKLAKKIINRLKLASTGIDTELVLNLIEHHMFETKASYTDKAIRRFVAKVGPENIYKLIDLRIADNRGGKHPSGIKGVMRLKKRIEEELAKKPPFGPKDLAINGNDIMALGIPEGRLIGIILKELVERVLDDPELNTKSTLEGFIPDIVKVVMKSDEKT